MDKHKIKLLKKSTADFVKVGFALFFMLAVLAYTLAVSNNLFLGMAALIGAYMAMNIGANDVANNVGPAVGSKAITLLGAIIIAAIFEISGAMIAGGEVVQTIKSGIIDIAAFESNPDSFVWAMMAALLAAALWLNFATMMRAPVSTTHSIVGGVMGAGIAAAGFSIISWATIGKIVASWVISPILGGIIAAGFLFAIKKTIIFQEDKIAAAKKWVPLFVAIMTWAFVTYIILKGLSQIWPQVIDLLNLLPLVALDMTEKPSFFVATTTAFITALFVYMVVRRKLSRKKSKLKNTIEGVNGLFTIPLVFAAALLSFAHGANDVANAIGPLAAINDAVAYGGIPSKANIPLWIMGVGALGIAIGLALYGPKLIKTVGSEITELNQIRAFSIAMSASVTVIVASQLGLPVSSTHIAIGGVFGVGFLREWLQMREKHSVIVDDTSLLRQERKVLSHLGRELQTLNEQESKTVAEYERIIALQKMIAEEEKHIHSTIKHLKKTQHVAYVQRDAIKKIVAAWIITLPVAALLAALFYYMIKGIMI